MPLSYKDLRGASIKGIRENQVRLPKTKKKSNGKEEEDAPLSPQELKKEQEAILRQAREKAGQERDKLLAEAEKEAVSLKEEAKEKGYQEGLKAGQKEGKKIKEDARKKLEEAEKKARQIVAEAEPEIIQMAVNLAEKLLHQQLQEKPKSIFPLLEKGLEDLPGGGEIKVYAAPQDLKEIKSNLDDIKGKLKEGTHLEVSADPSLQQGSVKVESEDGRVDVLLEENFTRIKETLIKLSHEKAQENSGEVNA